MIEHGKVNGSGHVQGSLHRFSCLRGYSIVGPETLYCTETGKWNGSEPKCLKGNKMNRPDIFFGEGGRVGEYFLRFLEARKLI